MLRDAVRGTEPRTVSGAVELAALELCLILPVWVLAAMAMGADLPTWTSMAWWAAGWVGVSLLRFALVRRRAVRSR